MRRRRHSTIGSLQKVRLFYIFSILLGVTVVDGLEMPAFTLGSTRSEVSSSTSDQDYVYDIWETTQCGIYHNHEGIVESEHPFLRGTSCMYNVTSDYPIEIRFTKIQMRETYRCVYDNVQLYVGSEMLSWLCTEEAEWMQWRKLYSNQFGIYFEGLSNLDKYGFKLEWRMPPELTSTTTTTTTTTTSTKTTTVSHALKEKVTFKPVAIGQRQHKPVTPTQYKPLTKWQIRQEEKRKKRKNILTGLFKTQYKAFKSRGKLRSNPRGLSKLLQRFNRMIDHVFKEHDRKQKPRKCKLNTLKLPQKKIDDVRRARTPEQLIILLKQMIAWQDTKCQRVNPNAWLSWIHKRAGNLKVYEKKYTTILI